MADTKRLVVFAGVGVVAIGGLGWMTYNNRIAEPTEAMRVELGEVRSRTDGAQRVFRNYIDTTNDLDALAGTALGRSAEQVVHRLRVALTAIANDAALSSVSVTSKPGRAQRSPVSTRVAGFDRDDPADFDVVDGALSATGSLDGIALALAHLTSQAWPMRIREITLRPTRDRDAVTLSLTVETIYWRDLSPREMPPIAPVSVERTAWAQRVVERLAFAPPPAPVAPPAPPSPPPPPGPPPPPPPPAPPAYTSWVVVGVASGSGGDELWIRNAKNGRERRLSVGQGLGGAVFRGLDGSDALIEIEGALYRLLPGSGLGDRDRPATDESRDAVNR